MPAACSNAGATYCGKIGDGCGYDPAGTTPIYNALVTCRTPARPVAERRKPFPTECKTNAMTPQGKALEFMFFDLSACLQPDTTTPVAPPPPALVPPPPAPPPPPPAQ